MKKFFLILIILLVVIRVDAQNSQLNLVYNQPAQKFKQAVPLGNGRLAATVFGGINTEKILLNDDTFWSGEPRDWNNPNGPKIVPQIHEALLKGNHELADKLAQKIQGPYNQSYQPLGELGLIFDHQGTPVDYSRSLDLEKALAHVSYKIDGVTYHRTIFSSFPDQAIVVLLEADKPGKLNFTIKLNGEHQRTCKVVKKNLLEGEGKAPEQVDPSYLDSKNPVIYAKDKQGKGMNYTTFVKVAENDGKVVGNGSEINVKKASRVVLYITSRTSFNGFDKSPSADGVNCEKLAMNDLSKIAGKNYSQLLASHIVDYQNLFKRVDLKLSDETQNSSTVEDYVKRFRSSDDPKWIELLFQIGRYMIIAGSRPGSQPLNLQGIWNEWVRPPWSSNYTMNINSQMNYWPVLPTNLAECHEPMLNFINELAINGEKTAKVNYNCKGWVAHHNADLWRQSAPVGDGSGEPSWANFMGGGIWESFDFWEQYQYTQDVTFLRDKAYPIFKGAVEFSLDWLKPDKDGHLVPPFTVSSEATYITPSGYKGYCTLNSGQDIAIYSELFTNFIKTCEILNINDDLYQRTKDALSKLVPYQIDPEGKIKEWLESGIDRPYGGNKNHLSQLIGFFPGRSLILQNNPSLIHAVKRTLEIFGPSTAGWMHAWEINLWARLKRSENSYELVKRLAGSYGPNDFNFDGGYQIDWLMGFTSGICEMLVQSHKIDENGQPVIELLPSLPKEWSSGHLYGVRTRGGFEIDMEWKNGRLTKGVIRNVANNGKEAKVTVVVNRKKEQLSIPANSEVNI